MFTPVYTLPRQPELRAIEQKNCSKRGDHATTCKERRAQLGPSIPSQSAESQTEPNEIRRFKLEQHSLRRTLGVKEETSDYEERKPSKLEHLVVFH